MMKKAIAIIQIVCILFWNVPPMLADDSDIFGNNIQPNVMILIDSSGSMDQEVASIAYDPNGSYSGSFTSTKVYRLDGDADDEDDYEVYKNSVAEVTGTNSAEAQAALNSVGFWSGTINGSYRQLYLGKYLNYLFCSTCSGMQPKIEIARTVVKSLVQNVTGVRFGVMKYKTTSPVGGTMVAEIGTAPGTISTLVDGINASGGTPTGEALRDVGKYFSGTFSTYSTPIQYSCQPNFVIVISDGVWTQSSPPLDPKTQAETEFNADHSSTFAGTQNLITHTVGFGLGTDPNDSGIVSLKDTAAKGGGSFYNANNSAQLQQSLQGAISQIIAATFSFATSVIPTTGTTGSNRAYLASFQSNASRPFWKGFLKAYSRDSNGLIPVDANGIPTGTPVWDAGQKLSDTANPVKTASSRTIYTVVGGSRQPFNNTYVTTTLLGAASDAERDKIINFIRGVDSYDEDADSNTTEERAWKLGDIFHSTSVFVSPPVLISGDTSYNSFKSDNASRTTVLIAGANDGMLHAFRESDGEELWAFIPPDLLGSLKSLTLSSATHKFYVDASPIAADIKVGSSWKTIVMFGERRGGKSYYALDISDNTKITTDPQYLWSFTDSKMGETWSEPAIGKIKKSDGTDMFVAFVGGGYDTAQNNNSGKAFFVIDLSNGAKLWEYYNPTGVTDDRQYMNFSLAAAPTAVDTNNDGYIDRVYIGDVGGQVWKFDVSTPATLSGTPAVITNWDPAQKGKRLFAAAPSQANPPAAGEFYATQAIYAPPTLAYDSAGNLWVFFGTGDRNHPNNTSTNRFYGIKENTTMANGSANTLTESSYTGYSASVLTNLTSGTGTVTQGWYIILGSNEKVLSASDVFNKVVFFTTFTPVTASVCGSGGGDAKLYAVNMISGDAALNLSTGAVLAPALKASDHAKAIGGGIPSRPIVILNQSGNTGSPYIITGTTNQQISNTPAPQVTVKRLLAWREVF